METDLIWMTLLVFLPSVFALGLIFFPRKWENAMCWWSLLGTAVTLGVSIAIFIGYKSSVVDRAGPNGDRGERVAISLDTRTAAMDAAAPEGSPKQFSSGDWVSRYPWI